MTDVPYSRIYLPFAAGYLMSYLFRVVTAVISPDLTRELALEPGALGLLTAVYFVAFAAMQIHFDGHRRRVRTCGAHAIERSRDHARVIDDQKIARTQERWEICDTQVLCIAPRRRVQQPRTFARAGGVKRNALRRQIEIKQVHTHRRAGLAAARPIAKALASAR